jgi:transcriptional regulator with XRE-family HTH domain
VSRRRVVASPFPTARKLRLPQDLYRARERSEPPRSEAARRLGEQLKALRVAAGLSGGVLARESGVSRSMISRVERGTASPSIETLERLARALGTPLSRLFSDQAERLDFSYVPAGGGLVVERVGVAAGYRYELVGHLLSGNLFVEPYLVQLAPQAPPYASFQHPGVKLLYMVSGRLRYRYGTRSMVLGLGDTLMFDATALHGVEQIEQGPVAYLSIVFTVRG